MSTTRDEHLRVRLRLQVFLSRARLDREIAGGGAGADSAARQMRAAQLTTREERRGIAAVLEVVLDTAQERGARGNRGHDVAAALDACEGLLGLIAALRAETPMSAQAVALAQELACDRGSPLRSSNSGRTVAESLARIAATMSPR